MRPPLAGLVIVVVLAVSVDRSVAVTPSERLEDPVLEERARELSKELRCLVCQNQSIDDSDADLAKDLRLLVRERIAAGDDDAQVLAYLTDRYGAFVRLRPPFSAATLALWLAPAMAILVAIGSALLYLRGRRQGTTEDVGLSAEEERALERLLSERQRRDQGGGDGRV